MRSTLMTLMVVAVTLCGAQSASAAAPAAPDESFGSGGTSTLGFDATEIAVDGSARIVVAGTRGSGEERRAVLARLTPEGRIDQSFGSAGVLALDIPASGPVDVASLAVLADGRIMLLGHVSRDHDMSARTFVARLLPDGQLDPSYSGDGYAMQLPVSHWSLATMVSSPSSESVGIARAGSGSTSLQMLRPDGRTDVSFGEAGVISATSLANGLAQELEFTTVVPVAWSMRTDGRLLYVAASQRETRRDRLVAFTPRGVLDTSFGGDGVVEQRAPSSRNRFLNEDEGADGQVHQLPDGRIVTVSVGVGAQTEVARYLADGRRDRAFSSDGIVAIPSGHVGDLSSAIDPAGRVTVLAGDRIFRIDQNGSFDPTVGGSRGELLPRVGDAARLDPAGRFLVAAGDTITRLHGGTSSATARRMTLAGPARCGGSARRACVMGPATRVLRGQVTPPPPAGHRTVRVRYRNVSCGPFGRVLQRWIPVRADGSFAVPLTPISRGTSRWRIDVDAFAVRDLAGASATSYVRTPRVRCVHRGTILA